MKILRKFTSVDSSPYEDIDFRKTASEIYKPDGTLLFQLENFEVPSHWSQNACDVLAQNYFRRTGVAKNLVNVPEEGVPEWLQRKKPANGNADNNSGNNNNKDSNEENILEGEKSAKQVFNRIAGAITYWGWKFGYFDTEEDAKAFFDEMRYMLVKQMASPSSPQWFNTGLHWAYGITGSSQGHYFVDYLDGAKVKKAENAFEHPQALSAFIQNISDDLINDNGILDLWTKETRAFKYGSGTGSNFSNIRGKNENLSNGRNSSGLMNFMEIGDKVASSIKEHGSSRKSSKIAIVNIDHPDIESFIDWKMIEDQRIAGLATGSQIMNALLNNIIKACINESDLKLRFDNKKNKKLAIAIEKAKRNLITPYFINKAIDYAKQGYTEIKITPYNTDVNSDLYELSSGQHTLTSIRIPKEFMTQVMRDGNWSLINRTDHSVASSLKARKLWRGIGEAVWSSTEPSIQFNTTINDWNTCQKSGSINASSPAGEFLFLDDTGVASASLNLGNFYDKAGRKFNLEEFEHAVKIWTIALDITISMSQYPSKSIAEKTNNFRPLGLGFTNFAGLLMMQGIAYDSDEGKSICAAISSVISATAYKTSALIAKEMGHFTGYNLNRENMLRVIYNHSNAALGKKDGYNNLSIPPTPFQKSNCPIKDLADKAVDLWQEAVSLGKQYGYRNAQVTALPPTGTIGLIMDCNTFGIEPETSIVKYTKNQKEKGYTRKINPLIPYALKELGYDTQQANEIIDYAVGKSTLEGSPAVSFKDLREKGFTDAAIDAVAKILKTTFDIRFAFNRWVLGDDFCTKILNIPQEKLDDVSFDILTHLGFSEKDIEIANNYCCGMKTFVGCKTIKKEHLPVFKCSLSMSRKSNPEEEVISPQAQIEMASSAQPFISGGISKTIKLSNSSDIDCCLESFMSSWKSGLKSCAIEREGAKLRLSQSMISTDDIENFAKENDNNLPHHSNVTKIAEKIVERVIERPIHIGSKIPLPGRRSGYTQKATVGGHKIYVRTGEYEDGRLGEVFIDMHKEGASFRSLMNCFSMAVSLGLQYGIPLEEFIDAFAFTRFEPSGAVTGNDHIKYANSVLDYVFRELAVSYLGRYDLAHIQKDKHKAATSGSKDDYERSAFTGASNSNNNTNNATSISPINEYNYSDHSNSNSNNSINNPSVIKINSNTTVSNNYNSNTIGSNALKNEYTQDEDIIGNIENLEDLKPQKTNKDQESINQKQYEGEECPNCGSFTMVREGRCLRCDKCGMLGMCS